jgi:hypothetical protein
MRTAENANDHEREARVHPASPDRHRGRQGDEALQSLGLIAT